MEFLDFKGQVVNVGFGDDWFLGIGLSINFVLIAEKGVASANNEAIVKDRRYD